MSVKIDLKFLILQYHLLWNALYYNGVKYIRNNKIFYDITWGIAIHCRHWVCNYLFVIIGLGLIKYNCIQDVRFEIELQISNLTKFQILWFKEKYLGNLWNDLEKPNSPLLLFSLLYRRTRDNLVVNAFCNAQKSKNLVGRYLPTHSTTPPLHFSKQLIKLTFCLVIIH